MNTATASKAAMMMWTGFMPCWSCSQSRLRRTPKNYHTTAFSEYRKDAF